MSTLSEIPTEVMEEISWWNGVQLRNVHNYLGIPNDRNRLKNTDESSLRLALLKSLLVEFGHAIWIKFGYLIEPARIHITQAEKAGNLDNLIAAYDEGRREIMKMASHLESKGILIAQQGSSFVFSDKMKMTPRKKSGEQAAIQNLYKSMDIVVEGYTLEKGRKILDKKLRCVMYKSSDDPACQDQGGSPVILDPVDLGIYPVDPNSQAACALDIREEVIQNTILADDFMETPLTEGSKRLLEESDRRKIKRLAVAFPTTSRGLKKNDDLAFMVNVMPSMIKTITEEEYNNTLITVYIGFDHGDVVFENTEKRENILNRLLKLIENLPIQVKLIQLPNARRVALLWNLLYLHSLRDRCDYFYQVNDDLTMVTPGWLTYFTETLDRNQGFGVVGPADFFHRLNCSILTQSMVTPVHYEIFGMLYPIELKDWKSDRWLTYVYQPNDMFCRNDFIANNGGAPTRYKHCEFLSYIIYLEAGKRRIAEWKALQQKQPPSIANT